MGTKGYDVFFADPTTVSTMKCKVCEAFCNVKRDVNGPTSWAGSMSGSNRLHDYFFCPNIGEAWHEQALELVKEIGDCHSPTLIRLMKGDLERLIKEQKVTI